MVKNKLNNSRYSFLYNDEDDVLDLVISPQGSYSEEIYPGIYKRFSMKNDRMIGLTILDFGKRNIEELSFKLPFKIDFLEVQSKIKKS